MSTATQVHPFEKAGLGIAPFKLVGFEHKVGPITVGCADGVTMQVGAPGQPMGVCDYCGTGIANCFVIRSSDGKRFIVGSDCVAKTDHAGLAREVTGKVNELKRKAAYAKREAKHAKDTERCNAARAKLEANPAMLDGQPHPLGFVDRATGKPLTMGDWAFWMLSNAGMSGRLAAARKIEEVNL